MRYGIASLLSALLLFGAGAAAAQDGAPAAEARSRSGEASLSSGRTLERGELIMAGGVGWPWIWLHLELAPSATFNVGIRVALLYASPVMALVPGVGAELSVPIRIHLHKEGDVDVALFATPVLTLGEGALAGEAGTIWAGALAWSARLEAGAVIGVRIVERLTALFGIGGHAALVHTPSAGGPEAAGALFARAGLEGFVSRATLLFVEVAGGIGISPSRAGRPLFGAPPPPLARVSLGMAYLF